jgi:guanylate kinase
MSLGTLYIVAAPSGGGKSSLVKNLIETMDDIEVSISHTTRPMRPGEEEGVHYFFTDEEHFNEMVDQGQFIEHAHVFDYWYGTSVEQITRRLQQGIDIVLDIDWQGAQQIRKLFANVKTIFLLPPSLEVLKQRLEQRGRDHEGIISERMKRAKDEISHYTEFDYLIVNDDFDLAASQLQTIVLANRLGLERQANKHAKLLSLLLATQ